AEPFGALDRAQAAGTIGAYGVSNFDAAQLTAALAAGAPQAIQNSYSLLTRQNEQDLLALCAERQVAYLVFSPLAGGWLTGKYRRGEPFPARSRGAPRAGAYPRAVTGQTVEAHHPLRPPAAGRRPLRARPGPR